MLMSDLFVVLMLLSALAFVILLIMLVVKAFRKKPLRKHLKIMGLSFVIGIISAVGVVITGVDEYEPESGNNSVIGTTISTETPSGKDTDADITKIIEPQDNNDSQDTLEAIEIKDNNNDIQEDAKVESSDTASDSKEAIKYKYSGDSLKKLLSTYLNTKKDSDKDKLKESNPLELYELIINNLNNEYKRYSNGVKASPTYRYFIDSCSIYTELYGNSSESSNLKKIVEYTDKVYKGEQELTKLKNKYGENAEEYLKSFSYEYFNMDFYVIQKLETSFGDTITGKLMKEIEAYKQSIPVQYVATSDYTYNQYIGYVAGENYCVVRPLDKFSKDGLYTLQVKMEGYITLEDNRGFEIEAPIYLELSDDYINAVYEDIDNYFGLMDSIFISDMSLKNLLDISTDTGFSSYAEYSYWECHRYPNLGLSLQMNKENAKGEMCFSTERIADTAEFECTIKNNQITTKFEDSFGDNGSFTLTLYENYIVVNLEYSGESGWFPQGEYLLTLAAN